MRGRTVRSTCSLRGILPSKMLVSWWNLTSVREKAWHRWKKVGGLRVGSAQDVQNRRRSACRRLPQVEAKNTAEREIARRPTELMRLRDLCPKSIWGLLFCPDFSRKTNCARKSSKTAIFSPPTSRPGQNRIRHVFFRVFPRLDNLCWPKRTSIYDNFSNCVPFFPRPPGKKWLRTLLLTTFVTFSDFFWPTFFSILDRFLQLYPFFRPRNLLNLEKWRRFVVLIYFLVFVSWGSRLYTDSPLNPLTYFSTLSKLSHKMNFSLVRFLKCSSSGKNRSPHLFIRCALHDIVMQ